MLLAIDTATRLMSLALHDGQALLAEQTWHTHNDHGVQLAPAVEHMLARCAVSVATLSALAVSIGPGSYTGLRIGIALAKGIATVNRLPLVGVTTLDTLAAAQPYYANSALLVVVQAGRGRITAGTYRWHRGRWVRRGEPQLMAWDALIASIDGTVHITGEIDADDQGILAGAQLRGLPVALVPAAYRLRRAGFLAEEAWTRLNSSREDFTAARVAPVYIQTADVP